MNKRIFKYTLVIICLFFIGIIPVSAKENCISVKEELEKYDSYTNILNSIDCSDNSNETNVATCNEFNVRKVSCTTSSASAAFLQTLNAAANKWSLYFSTNTSVAILMSDPSYFFSV